MKEMVRDIMIRIIIPVGAEHTGRDKKDRIDLITGMQEVMSFVEGKGAEERRNLVKVSLGETKVGS